MSKISMPGIKISDICVDDVVNGKSLCLHPIYLDDYKKYKSNKQCDKSSCLNLLFKTYDHQVENKNKLYRVTDVTEKVGFDYGWSEQYKYITMQQLDVDLNLTDNILIVTDDYWNGTKYLSLSNMEDYNTNNFVILVESDDDNFETIMDWK
jgi:hypothetical protein